MQKQYVFTEEEVKKLTDLVQEAHDVIWVDIPNKGYSNDIRLDLLKTLSVALDLLRGDS